MPYSDVNIERTRSRNTTRSRDILSASVGRECRHQRVPAHVTESTCFFTPNPSITFRWGRTTNTKLNDSSRPAACELKDDAQEKPCQYRHGTLSRSGIDAHNLVCGREGRVVQAMEGHVAPRSTAQVSHASPVGAGPNEVHYRPPHSRVNIHAVGELVPDIRDAISGMGSDEKCSRGWEPCPSTLATRSRDSRFSSTQLVSNIAEMRQASTRVEERDSRHD